MKKKKTKVWKILYKTCNEENWNELKGPKNYWYADPMLIDFNEDKYLFVEAFNMYTQIGHLAVSKYDNFKFNEPKIIINCPFHLSYPCVFKYNKELYMLPETGQNGTLELWKCIDNDVYKWEKYCVLLNNVKYADSTVLLKDNKYFIVTYEEKEFKTIIYELDIKNKKVIEIEKIINPQNNKRPAGKFLYRNNNFYRPVQNNIESYGKEMLINKILSFKPFKEKTIYKIISNQYGDKYKGLNTHTLAIDNELEIVDVLDEEELPFYCRMVWIRKIRNLIYKINFKINKKVNKKYGKN